MWSLWARPYLITIREWQHYSNSLFDWTNQLKVIIGIIWQKILTVITLSIAHTVFVKFYLKDETAFRAREEEKNPAGTDIRNPVCPRRNRTGRRRVRTSSSWGRRADPWRTCSGCTSASSAAPCCVCSGTRPGREKIENWIDKRVKFW